MADQNLVTSPPLTTRIVEANGMINRTWAIWFRNVYKRTSDKRGNAIDANNEQINENILGVGSSLEDTIQRVNANASATESHVKAKSAHGVKGDVVGTGDIAQLTTAGVVLAMNNLAAISQSAANVSSPSVSAAPASYDQVHAQSVVTLVNECKTSVNQLVSDLNDTIDLLNSLITQAKASGQMSNE